jgi:hypothetical protein
MLARIVILLSICTLGIRFGRPAPAFAVTDREQSGPPVPIRKYTGTITRNGDQFVLNEAKTHALYQLDDQAAASKFENQTVIVTGTMDAIKNIIRIQSIAQATP